MPGIRPSPALVIRADTPITDAIRQMKANQVGSMLVVSDDGKGELIGIFTERDLVQYVDLVQQGGHWNRPIRTVMTSPVITLDLVELDRAPEVMLQKGFRHLPIVTRDEEGKPLLVGVISMRDLFRSLVDLEKNQGALIARLFTKKGKTPTSLAVITEDDTVHRLLRDAFAPLKQITVQKFTGKGIRNTPPKYSTFNALVFDLDEWDLKQATEVLKKLNSDPDAPFTILLFDPTRHPQAAIRALEDLKNARKFEVFVKPADLLSLFRILEPMLNK